MKIWIPAFADYERINELACQVHELHVKWRPDLFLETKEAINKERFKILIEEQNIYVAKIEDKIVGYVTFSVQEKENHLTVNEENQNAIKVYEKFGMKVKNIAYSKEVK